MGFLHSHPTASVTDEFHCCQLVFTDVLGLYFRCTAETAFFFIVTGIAQMTWCIGYGAAVFT
jgi:hypothetical protein